MVSKRVHLGLTLAVSGLLTAMGLAIVHQNNSYCRSQLQCMHTLWDHKDLVLSSDLDYSQVKISLLLLQQPVKQQNAVDCPAQMVFSGTREDARFAGVDNVSQLVSSHIAVQSIHPTME